MVSSDPVQSIKKFDMSLGKDCYNHVVFKQKKFSMGPKRVVAISFCCMVIDLEKSV